MTTSILTDTKKVLGLAEDYTAFDPDLIMHINSVLMIISQLGIGPEEGTMITGKDETWTMITGNDNMHNTIKSYMYTRVRLLFDPPNTSFLIKAIEDQLRELEWRLNIYRETHHWTDPNVEVEV